MGIRLSKGVKISNKSVICDFSNIPIAPTNFTYAYSTLQTYNTVNLSPPNTGTFPSDGISFDNTYLNGQYNILGFNARVQTIQFTFTNNLSDDFFSPRQLTTYFYNGVNWDIRSTPAKLSADAYPPSGKVDIFISSPSTWQPTIINGFYAYWLILGPENFSDPATLTPINQLYSAQVVGIIGTPIETRAYTVQTFTTPGAGSWTKPLGVTEVIVECWGGGGAGGGATLNNQAGHGGAGGQYARKTITYGSAQQSISYSVAASVAGTTGNGATGNDTTWDTNVVVAKGGTGGPANSSDITENVPTGSINGGIGDVVFSGFDQNGEAGSTGIPSGQGGGRGGLGAGSYGISGTSFDFGGAGGTFALASTQGVNGNPGENYGGAGGGAAKVSGANRSGGAGAQGLIRISYR
jgi:hypothetical protein